MLLCFLMKENCFMEELTNLQMAAFGVKVFPLDGEIFTQYNITLKE